MDTLVITTHDSPCTEGIPTTQPNTKDNDVRSRSHKVHIPQIRTSKHSQLKKEGRLANDGGLWHRPINYEVLQDVTDQKNGSSILSYVYDNQ
jgi:hypothetical protein